ncbi:hypothetical protein [Paenilisteria rocourtiae]|uniref:Uncharacterized protein n=1 Tax=Listeria rocourtiae TaxID=647910 RepID=A0A4R6ZDM2_9LIST|nr:hypothetical protein [Listeria rocourtiae]EUJ42130.1 hypothetical protein PROCOU_17660 [Listeria rocourtiae FSL F6-920]MBC1435325.1 hypothetical protein [Listeria rocourtiae]MBC1606089.1 hypothetical protein [Listeria rocourtiae]TDR50200.1 hypothetical protein DFP96_1333 [Listeria rocourtiae]
MKYREKDRNDVLLIDIWSKAEKSLHLLKNYLPSVKGIEDFEVVVYYDAGAATEIDFSEKNKELIVSLDMFKHKFR